MLKFKVNGKEYEINYENLVFNISSRDFDADNVVVLCDGKEQSGFGESFAGYAYTKEDALLAMILAYVNNDTSYDFISVPDEIKKIRQGFFKKQDTVNGRDIPEQFISFNLEVCDVKMITKDGRAAYIGTEETIMTYPDGSVATDMENFFIEGVIDMYQTGDIIFIDPDFEFYLEENYLEDDLESVKIKSVVDKILEGNDIRQTIFKVVG